LEFLVKNKNLSTSIEKSEIRLANLSDAVEICALSAQLGYQVTPEQSQEWLEAILKEDWQTVFVAMSPNGKLIGWEQVSAIRHLMEMPFAEIIGIVVAETHRGEGIGEALLEHAETWAQEKGLSFIWVRSNVIRMDAHHFYLRYGFELLKTQQVFIKRIS
jgi:GNAT superfamily N-acetyltransferase